MNDIHYIGFDVHKKSVSFCVKTASGEIMQEGQLVARREVLRAWAAAQPQPWRGAMEATLFSAWIYDTLKPYAQQLDMGHPARMKAITAGQEKERSPRCAHHCRPAALQPAAHLLRALAGDARPAPAAPLSPARGGPIRAHAEQDGWPTDGDGSALRQSQIARQEILHPTVGDLTGSAGVGEGSAAHEPWRHGDVRGQPETTGPAVARPNRSCKRASSAWRAFPAWAPSRR